MYVVTKEILDKIKNMRLLDDNFMTKFFEGDVGVTQYVLRIIMDIPTLRVLRVETQKSVATLYGKGVRLDVFAVDSVGNEYDIEVQRSDQGAVEARARYNSSMMDAEAIQKGSKTYKLPETYVIFFTEHDYFGAGIPIYHIDRHIRETNQIFNDGAHIIYVNAEYDNLSSEIGKLVHDFRCTKADEIFNETIRNKFRFLKETDEGREIMCRAVEELTNEAEILGYIRCAVKNNVSASDVKRQVLEDYRFLSEADVACYYDRVVESLLQPV